MHKYKSTTHYILAGLVPFTNPNLKLVFKPNLFFKDLAKLERLSEKNIRTAFDRAVTRGLITIKDGRPELTAKGCREVRPFISKKLIGSKLMVIFDIAENDRSKRNKLRTLLRELSFKQVQKSVWVSEFDHREYIKAEIDDLDLGKSVLIYETREL